MIKKLPIKPYKWHQKDTKRKDYAYMGVALTRKEKAVFLKINEIIKKLNTEDSLAN